MMQLTDRQTCAWEPSKRPPSKVPPRRPRCATEESGLVQTAAAAAAALALVVSVRAQWTEEGRIHLRDYFWPKWPSTRFPLPPAVLHLLARLLLIQMTVTAARQVAAAAAVAAAAQ